MKKYLLFIFISIITLSASSKTTIFDFSKHWPLNTTEIYGCDVNTTNLKDKEFINDEITISIIVGLSSEYIENVEDATYNLQYIGNGYIKFCVYSSNNNIKSAKINVSIPDKPTEIFSFSNYDSLDKIDINDAKKETSITEEISDENETSYTINISNISNGNVYLLINTQNKALKINNFIITTDTPDPENPGTTDPEGPGATDPEGPGTTDPEGPGTTDPEGPGTTDPEGPGTTDPEGPGTTNPENPGTTDPEGPGTTEPEPSVTPEYDHPLNEIEVDKEVELSNLNVLLSGNGYILAQSTATNDNEAVFNYILKNTGNKTYSNGEVISINGTKIIDEDLLIPIVAFEESVIEPSFLEKNIEGITVANLFEIVKLDDVAINNNVISQGESSIALKDAFGKFGDNITYNKAKVTGVVGKTCRPQSTSARKKAEGEVLAIYPMKIVNTSVPVTEAKSQKEDFGISGENGCITIIGEWKEIEIFDTKGRLISRDKATTACSAGIYFVKVNDMTHIVKVD